MKAWIISDMHVTHADMTAEIDIPPADICVCAGDISGFLAFGLEFLRRRIVPTMPVVIVLGNHDYYGNTINGALSEGLKATGESNIHLLENETLEIGHVRIIGATLWTDYQVPWGIDDELPLPDRAEAAVSFCRRSMLDFREIYGSPPFREGMPRLITSREIIARHMESKAFISGEMAKSWTGKTVVLTHHAPSPRSLLKQYQGEATNAAFASDLTEVIQNGRPDIWIHGHIHQFQDYVEGHTRVICNPLGYRHERGKNGYRHGFVIEL
ncbi:metallophosphoesterase [Rhizobium lemnae]|uniref:Metallophosphoesterase n=1 Tax=Rhizobium lemnae TaxID=1214924 RepID=A0ABV8E6X0_9HYPH|nr:metallophosphoesterase [Rhizobium lemnae]MCJ8506771.1 metallophosphoesterase [Rhizobium lemnae]